jgi:hypothetical protein
MLLLPPLPPLPYVIVAGGVVLVILCVISCIASHRWLSRHGKIMLQPCEVADTVYERFPKDPIAYLVIRCYNGEGGAFWHLHNCILAAHVAAQYNLQLVVIFDTGFYVERDPMHRKKYYPLAEGGNWFNYYFHPLGEALPFVKDRFLHAKENIRPFGTVGERKYVTRGEFLEFTRDTFASIRTENLPWKLLFDIYCQPREHVLDAVEQYVEKNMVNGWTIGIHWRGTDKYGDGNDDEDGPKHFEYEWMGRMIEAAYETCKHDPTKGAVSILICTDEQPFVSFMRSRFSHESAHIVHATNALRSDINTGGLHLQSQACKTDHDYATLADCKKLKSMAGTSVHRGMQHESAYQKGLDVILDVLLLARCNQLFLSRGNVSSWAGKLFSETPAWSGVKGAIVDMVATYEPPV